MNVMCIDSKWSAQPAGRKVYSVRSVRGIDAPANDGFKRDPYGRAGRFDEMDPKTAEHVIAAMEKAFAEL